MFFNDRDEAIPHHLVVQLACGGAHPQEEGGELVGDAQLLLEEATLGVGPPSLRVGVVGGASPVCDGRALAFKWRVACARVRSSDTD